VSLVLKFVCRELLMSNHLTVKLVLQVIQNQKVQPVPDQKFDYHPASLKLRDWLVSRQRKWGTPIPVVTCQDCGEAKITIDDLPVTNDSPKPTGKCSNCGSSNIERESDTLDTFFDSSWYFIRFLDPQNTVTIFDPYTVNKSLPVDIYVGGKEHGKLDRSIFTYPVFI
jgi:leucyl-tRNA synthetase